MRCVHQSLSLSVYLRDYSGLGACTGKVVRGWPCPVPFGVRRRPAVCVWQLGACGRAQARRQAEAIRRTVGCMRVADASLACVTCAIRYAWYPVGPVEGGSISADGSDIANKLGKRCGQRHDGAMEARPAHLWPHAASRYGAAACGVASASCTGVHTPHTHRGRHCRRKGANHGYAERLHRHQ